MAAPTITQLIDEDEPTAEEAARAMAAALRRNQQLGMLATLSGGKLAPAGQALGQQAAQEQQLLANSSNARVARKQARTAAELKAAQDLRDFLYQRQKDAADLEQRRQASAATLALAAANLGVKRGEAADKQVEQDESQVRDLSKNVGENPKLIAEKLARIEAAVKKGGDLPGIGALDSRLPAALQPVDGIKLRSDATELVNTLLNIQSGTGVSNTERENKYRAYGVNEGASEDAFRAGMATLRNDLAKALEAKQAGYKPEVVQTYKGRGGVVPEDLNPAAADPMLQWARTNPGAPGAAEILAEHGEGGR